MFMKIMQSSSLVGDGKYSLSSSVELSELISSPGLGLGIVVLEIADGSVRVVSLLNVALVALVHIIMEGILKGNRVELVGALHFHSQGSDDGFVGSPRVRHQSSGVEESRSDNVGLEVFLNSSLFESPAHNLNVGVRVIDDLELMKAVAAPIVALSDRPTVKVEVSVVMIAEVIGRVDVASHKQKLFGEALTYLIIVTVGKEVRRKGNGERGKSVGMAWGLGLGVGRGGNGVFSSWDQYFHAGLKEGKRQGDALKRSVRHCDRQNGCLFVAEEQSRKDISKQNINLIDKTSLYIEISLLSIIYTKKAVTTSNYFPPKTLIFPHSSDLQPLCPVQLQITAHLHSPFPLSFWKLFIPLLYSIIQHMKTSQSFFPTRTHLKSRQIKRDHTYQLIKKPDDAQGSAQEEDFTINIFKDARMNQLSKDIEMTVQRPVGGLELFKKMQQAGRERMNENRRHSKRSNKESTQRNISSNFNNNRFRKDRAENEDRENQDAVPFKPINEENNPQLLRNTLPEETFKSHLSYAPHSASNKSHSKDFSKIAGRSEAIFRPMSSKPSSKTSQFRDEWAAAQRRQYQDKAALLNEINYNRPLIEVYGDRYFEFMLRNRFEEDRKQPAYIYQLGSSKFSQSRAIANIKKYRPDIREKGMMVLRGRKLANDD